MRSLVLIPLLSMGLTLQADVHLSANEEYSQEQAYQYCRDLGPQWRLMQIQEIFNLPGSTPFVSGFSYWSATNIMTGEAIIGTGSEGDGGVLAHVGLAYYAKERNVTPSPENKKIAAICTDLPQAKQIRKYTLDTLGTKDGQNGLLWHSLDATDKKAKYTYEGAAQMCENLALGGRSWRLPTLDEMYSIVDYSFSRPTLDMKYFGPVMQRYYWTSDTLNENSAFVVGFKLGSVATVSTKEDVYTRCVSELE
ncbi:MAG: DUF1566 domain-containing protein [Sulfuricurvum sp.]|nr:DUF1566 domain-containing protein [Sulfuricurvum sp.]